MRIIKSSLILLGIIGTSAIGYFFYQGGTFSDISDMVRQDTDISDSELLKLYNESRPQLIAGYKKGDNDIAKAYENWAAVSTVPASPGVHSGRYMMTYVNESGHSIYSQYDSQGVNLPVGTKIAKESFMVKGKGDFSPSPLFTMEKVGVDKAPETDGWFYGRVNRNGRKMITSQKFCHSCHEAFKGQDSLGYPVTKARLNYDANGPQITAAKREIGDVASGKQAFQSCGSCHNIGPNAQNAFGPVLSGVVGRPAASYPGYKYSSDLKAAKDKGLIWDEDSLYEWLAGPSEFLQNYLGDDKAASNMPIQFADPKLRSNVIAYLKSQSDGNNAEP